METRTEKRVFLIKDLLKERISKQEAADELRTTIRTVERYVSRFLEKSTGSSGNKGRRSNFDLPVHRVATNQTQSYS